MKITYENYVGKSYTTRENKEDNDFIIGSSSATDSTTPITLFDSSSFTNNDYPIYTEFADADTEEKAKDFCKTYGAIINLRLVPKNDSEYHSFQTLSAFNDYKGIYDCISYNHFRYYQLQMKCLLELHRLLNSSDLSSDNILNPLLINCLTLICNPNFSTMFQLEYSETVDHSKYLEYFSEYPVIDYMYRLDSDEYWEDVVFDNPQLSSFLIEVLSVYSVTPDFSHSFLINNKEQIISLAKYIFSGVLSFEIRNIYPKISFKNSEIVSDWQFPSLISAMFFYFYLDRSNSKVITRCANEKCNKFFVHSGAYSKRIYCCPECAHRVANRKYKKKNQKTK